jgi:surfeit locus 1 family protein
MTAHLKLVSSAPPVQPAPPAPPRRRSKFGILPPAFFVFVVLIGLGVWQIERKAWKEGLIAAVTTRVDAPPQPLLAASAWLSLDEANDEYRRVSFSAQFDHKDEALVFAAATGFRPDVDNAGPGYWVFTPARLADGSTMMVNRGFVPDGKQDPKSRPDGQVSGPVEIMGAMRWPDPRHWFTPGDDPAHNLWFSRDPAAIAAAKGIGPVAPFYVEQETPAPPGGLPQPGKLVVSLPDNHLQYALTWFGLAAVLAGVVVSWLLTSAAEGSDEASDL